MLPLLLAGSLAAAAVTSMVLLRNPHLLHRRKRHAFRAVHISHRGGAGEEIENTMEAFEAAMGHSTDMLELDVHLTACHEVVVAHDRHLERLAAVDGNRCDIHEIPFHELPELRQSLEVTFSPGSVSTADEARKFVRLEDVLDRFPATPIHLDLKHGSDELIHKVAKLVADRKREHVTVWGAASHDVARRCHAANPDVLKFMSSRRVMQIYALYFTGLLPFVRVEEDFFSIPMPMAMLPMLLASPRASTWRVWLLRLMDWVFMRPGLFRHLRSRGIQVVIWVLNDDKAFDRAFELGASGVMTDYPSHLRAYLRSRQLIPDDQ